MITTRLEKGIAVFQPQDSCGAQHMMRALDAYYGENDTRDAIWDFRAGRLADFSASDFKDVAHTSARCATVRGPGARTAFVVASEMDELLVQAFVIVADKESPVTFRVFRNINAAWDWLVPDGQ